MKAWRADPLVWGHGPRIFEVFLEPTCPFSVKAFGKLDDLLDQAGYPMGPDGVRIANGHPMSYTVLLAPSGGDDTANIDAAIRFCAGLGPAPTGAFLKPASPTFSMYLRAPSTRALAEPIIAATDTA